MAFLLLLFGVFVDSCNIPPPNSTATCASLPKPPSGCIMSSDCSSLSCSYSGFPYQIAFSIALDHCSLKNVFGGDPYIELTLSGSVSGINLGTWTYKQTCTDGMCSLDIPITVAGIGFQISLALKIIDEMAVGCIILKGCFSGCVTLISLEFLTLFLNPCPFYATSYFVAGVGGAFLLIGVAFCYWKRKKNQDQKISGYTPLPESNTPVRSLKDFENAIVTFYTERGIWQKIQDAPKLAKNNVNKQDQFWQSAWAKYPPTYSQIPTPGYNNTITEESDSSSSESSDSENEGTKKKKKKSKSKKQKKKNVSQPEDISLENIAG